MIPNFEQDYRRAVQWAQRMLRTDGVVILDSETTDFKGELVELAMIDLAGNVLYNQQFEPMLPIHPGAIKVHGLTATTLKGKPKFWAEYVAISSILRDASVVLIYNAPFDVSIIDNTCDLHRTPPIRFNFECVMEQYAVYCQAWSEWHRSYTWQKLPGGDHSALGDAKATLDALKRMAGEGE